AMTGANAAFLADQYARWVEDPNSVDPSFGELFAALNDDARAVLTDAMGASWAPRPRGGFAPVPEAPPTGKGKGAAAGAAGAPEATGEGRGRRARGRPGGNPPRPARCAPRADADPLLPGARASGSAARPA